MDRMKMMMAATAFGFAALLGGGMPGTASAADVFGLSTENGVELFIVESEVQGPPLSVRATPDTRIQIADDGAMSYGRPDSLGKYFGLDGNVNVKSPAPSYQGFRKSPLGRVLGVDGQFQPNLGRSVVETADGTAQSDRRFDLGQPQKDRAGWETGGMRILSF